MRRHELNCFLNPARECKLCREKGQPQPESVKLYQIAEDGGGVAELRAAAGGCPMCMMAALMRSQQSYRRVWGREDAGWVEFNYEKEARAFLGLDSGALTPSGEILF
jgi:hypothetical protein